MHQPVTNDPLVIMIINMVIVFAVLTAVWALIEITHRIDPTKKKSDPPAAQPAGGAAPPPPAPPPADSRAPAAARGGGIAAAVSACGCSADQIQAIRPAEQPAWTGFGRVSGMRS